MKMNNGKNVVFMVRACIPFASQGFRCSREDGILAVPLYSPLYFGPRIIKLTKLTTKRSMHVDIRQKKKTTI